MFDKRKKQQLIDLDLIMLMINNNDLIYTHKKTPYILIKTFLLHAQNLCLTKEKKLIMTLICLGDIYFYV